MTKEQKAAAIVCRPIVGSLESARMFMMHVTKGAVPVKTIRRNSVGKRGKGGKEKEKEKKHEMENGD